MEVRLVASTTQAIVLVTRALQVSDLAKKRDLLPIFVARKTRTVHRMRRHTTMFFLSCDHIHDFAFLVPSGWVWES